MTGGWGDEDSQYTYTEEDVIAIEAAAFERGTLWMRDMAAVVVVQYGAEIGVLKEIKEAIWALPLN